MFPCSQKISLVPQKYFVDFCDPCSLKYQISQFVFLLFPCSQLFYGHFPLFPGRVQRSLFFWILMTKPWLHYKQISLPSVIAKSPKQTRLTLKIARPNSFSKTHIAIRFNLLQLLSIRKFFRNCCVIPIFHSIIRDTIFLILTLLLLTLQSRKKRKRERWMPRNTIQRSLTRKLKKKILIY